MDANPEAPLRVLVVDDSPVARDLLSEILASAENVDVVGVACDGREGVDLVERLRPDVVTMDVHMPRLDGYEATREIMTTCPTPIVIVSGSMRGTEVEGSMQALTAGALTVLGKPPSPGSPGFDQTAAAFVETVRAMAEVKVVRRRSESQSQRSAMTTAVGRTADVVAIGTSTGGPRAVHELLSLLPADYPIPILLVQHITPGFLDGYVSFLNDSVPLQVVVAESGQRIRPGTVYVGPENCHLGLNSDGRIVLSQSPPIDGFRPAVTALFESVARACGRAAVACIMTGMGRDGVEGLRVLRDHEGFVLAQNEESCAVFGMPAAAAEAGLVDQTESIDGLAAALLEFTASGRFS